MKRAIIAGAVLTFTGWASIAGFFGAQAQSAPSTGGDVEYGRYLSSECVTCHQVSGVDEGIPSITGWEEKTFIAVLKAYQERDLPNRVMRNVAANLDDDQIRALAAFFATLPSPN